MTVDVESLLKSLPQGKVIPLERARQWLNAVPHGQDVEWHVRRLSGFGGSDIGTLVQARRGLYSPFASARDVVGAKLMLVPPAPPTPKMRRGTIFEAAIARLFAEDYGAQRVPEALAAIRDARVPQHPWLIGNPDDVVCFPDREGLYVVDYKAPDDTQDARQGLISLGYACQLQHYATLARLGAQLPIRGLILAPLNYLEGRVDPVYLDLDPSLEREILETGDHYWNMVLSGVLPEEQAALVAKAQDSYSTAELVEIRRLEQAVLAASCLRAAVTEHLDQAKEALAKVLAGRSPSGVLRHLTARTRVTINEEALVELAARLGKPLDELRKPEGELDAGLMAAYLAEQGVDLDRFARRSFDVQAVEQWLEEKGLPADGVLIRQQDLYATGLRSNARSVSPDIVSMRRRSTELVQKAYDILVSPQQEGAFLQPGF